MNGARGLEPGALWNVVCALTMSLTLLLAALYGHRRQDKVPTAYRTDWPIVVLMAAFTLPATSLVAGDVPIINLASTVITEVGMAWLYVRWGVFLAGLDVRSAVGCIFSAHVVGCAAKLCLYYVPVQISCIPVSLLPILSMTLLRLACRCSRRMMLDGNTGIGETGIRAQNLWCTGKRGAWGPVWKVAAFIACYRLISQAVATSGSSFEDLSLSTICCIAEIVVSLIIVYMLFVKSGSFTFQQVWSIFLLLLGVVLACSSSQQTLEIGLSIRSAVGSLLVMFMWLVFANIAHHSTVHPFVLFGIARIAYEVPKMLVEGASLLGCMPPTGFPVFTGLLFFVLLAFAVFFFDWRDPTLALIFSDFQKRDSDSTPDKLQEVCRQAAVDHGLTQREEQVLLYLCQGRTRAYIAETLYLSENTVRGHTQRIYGKLGVHNKTELQRMLGV